MAVICIGSAGWAEGAEPSAPLVLERRILLPGTSGRIDHMAVDLRRGRLFVAELGNGTLDVVDLGSGKVVHRIAILKEPQGVGYDPDADIVAVAGAGSGSVRLYHGADYAPSGQVDLGDNADNIRLDWRTNRFVVGYGSGGLSAIEPGSARLVGRTALPAHPEGFQIDPVRRRAYVNLPDKHQLAKIDLDGSRPVETSPLPQASGNFPMALNETRSILAIATRSSARLMLLNPASGRLPASRPAATPTTCAEAASHHGQRAIEMNGQDAPEGEAGDLQ